MTTSNDSAAAIRRYADQYLAQYDQTYPNHRPGSPGEFLRNFWSDFNPTAAVSVLLKGGSYPGHAEIVLAGLCAWIVKPGSRNFIQSAMLHAATLKLAAAERVAKKALSTLSFGADLLARQTRLGPYFFTEIYYPMGGVAKIASTRSKSTMLRSWQKAKTDVETAVKIVQVFHAYNEAIGVRTTKNPVGVNRIAQNLHELFPIEKRKTVVKDAWRDHRDNIAYLYAAHATELPDGRTMLMSLLSSDREHDAIVGAMPEFFGKAAFVKEDILKYLPRASSWDAQPPTSPLDVLLDGWEPIPFESDLSRTEVDKIFATLVPKSKKSKKAR